MNRSLNILAESMELPIEENDCEDLEMNLEAQSLLDLSDLGIRDLRPLAKLPLLRQLYLGKMVF